MYHSKKLFALAAFFIFCLGLNSSLAQTPNSKPSEPSFDVVLQTVVASNDAGKTEIAGSLSNIVKKLRADFPFSNYRLSSTSIQRVSNRSGVSSKNISFTPEKNLAVYSTLTIDSLDVLINEQGQEIFQIRRFGFNQQLPITNSIGAINYSDVNLNGNFSLMKNTPTVVGSLTTLKSGELLFLIMTVKPAEK